MTTQNYVTHRIKQAAHHPVDAKETAAIAQLGMTQFILSRLFAKKFRKWKLDPACIARTSQAVVTKVAANQPLKVVYPQGGYKLWRLPSSPTADWAEVFVVGYVLEYLAPIAAHYQPGVEIVFYLHTLLMEIHDNLTTAEISAYVESLQKILDTYQRYCPRNVTLSLVRDADIYSRPDYTKALEIGKKQAALTYASWPIEQQQRYQRMAELNIKWWGRERWDLLDHAAKQDKLYQAALYEIAATQNLPKVAQLVKSPENVLIFTKPTPEFIGIGSTKTSMAKYWVGYGVLESDGQKFYERVLSPSQWQHCQTQEFHTESVSIETLEFLPPIAIFPRLNFAKA